MHQGAPQQPQEALESTESRRGLSQGTSENNAQIEAQVRPPPYHPPPPYYSAPPLMPPPFQGPFYSGVVPFPGPSIPPVTIPVPPPLVVLIIGLPKSGCSSIATAVATDLRMPLVSAAATLKRDKEEAESSPHRTVFSSHTWGQAHLIVAELEQVLQPKENSPSRPYAPPPTGLILDWTPWNSDELFLVVHWMVEHGYPLTGVICIDASADTPSTSPISDKSPEDSEDAPDPEATGDPIAAAELGPPFHGGPAVLQRLLSDDAHDGTQENREAAAQRKLARSCAAQRELRSLFRALHVPLFTVANPPVEETSPWLPGAVGRVKGALARLRAQRPTSSEHRESVRTAAVESDPLQRSGRTLFVRPLEEKRPKGDDQPEGATTACPEPQPVPKWCRLVRSVEEFTSVMELVARALHRCGVKEKRVFPTATVQLLRESVNSVLQGQDKKKGTAENSTPETSPSLHPTPAVTVEEEDALLLLPFLHNEHRTDCLMVITTKKLDGGSSLESSKKTSSPELAVFLIPFHQQCVYAVPNPSALLPFKVDPTHLGILVVVFCPPTDFLRQEGKRKNCRAVIVVEDVIMWEGRNFVGKSYHARVRPLYHGLHAPEKGKPKGSFPVISLLSTDEETEGALWKPNEASGNRAKMVVLRAVPLPAIADAIPRARVSDPDAPAMWKLAAAHGIVAFQSRTPLRDTLSGSGMWAWRPLTDLSFHFQLGACRSESEARTDENFTLLSWQQRMGTDAKEGVTNHSLVGAGDLATLPISSCTLRNPRHPRLRIGDIVEVRPEFCPGAHSAQGLCLRWQFLRRGSQRASPDAWSTVQQSGILQLDETDDAALIRNFEAFAPLLQAAARAHSTVSQLREMIERQQAQK